jgi:hypothetical protein
MKKISPLVWVGAAAAAFFLYKSSTNVSAPGITVGGLGAYFPRRPTRFLRPSGMGAFQHQGSRHWIARTTGPTRFLRPS